jgi:hypothetical protein
MDTLHEFPPRAGARGLACSVAWDLHAALARRGRASLGMSGERAPVAFLERLALEPLAWSGLDVALADERGVPPDQAGSNDGLVRRHLLREAARVARLAAMKNDASPPGAGAARFEAALEGMLRRGSRHGQRRSGRIAVSEGAGATGRARSARGPSLHSGRSARRTAWAPQPHESAVWLAARAAGPVEALPVRTILRRGVVPADVYGSPGER